MSATSFLLVAFAYVTCMWTSPPPVSAAESCSSAGKMKTGRASAVKSDDGSSLCAVDSPSDILTPVRSLLDCQRSCSRSTGCWNFSYFKDTKRCEIFNFLPNSLVVGIPHCKHYQARRVITTRALQCSIARVVLLSVVSVCLSVCLFVCLFVCQHENSTTVRDIIMEFSENHPVVEREAKFENSYRPLVVGS